MGELWPKEGGGVGKEGGGGQGAEVQGGVCGRVGEKALFFRFFERDPIFYIVLLVVRFPDDLLGKTFMSVGEPDHGGGGVGPLADKCCQVNGKQQQQ